MENLDLPSDLKEKIYDIKFPKNGSKGKITTYFPLTSSEQKKLMKAIGEPMKVDFQSIFSDIISDDEWNSTKEQIKKKFQNELIDLD